METIEVPLRTLRALIFGFDDFFAQRPISVIPNEAQLYPKLVPKSIGRLLEQVNNNEPPPRPFHIIHYPNHSEVWHTDHWMLSASRKWEQSLHNQERSAQHQARLKELNRLSALKQAIAQVIIKWAPVYAHKSQTESLAKMVALFSTLPKEVAADLRIPGLVEVLYPNER